MIKGECALVYFDEIQQRGAKLLYHMYTFVPRHFFVLDLISSHDFYVNLYPHIYIALFYTYVAKLVTLKGFSS